MQLQCMCDWSVQHVACNKEHFYVHKRHVAWNVAHVVHMLEVIFSCNRMVLNLLALCLSPLMQVQGSMSTAPRRCHRETEGGHGCRERHSLLEAQTTADSSPVSEEQNGFCHALVIGLTTKIVVCKVFFACRMHTGRSCLVFKRNM